MGEEREFRVTQLGVVTVSKTVTVMARDEDEALEAGEGVLDGMPWDLENEASEVETTETFVERDD